ncbi:heme biosynthesis protein HemY [Notoacmeibacter sp. MSK16QG-6]|uniref:heme biosynthesis protein HemY n=1 Tax=Notoacmeibacter sp. MSK16QG-6 TaxID=2957982 RepID=UPI0020A1FE8A|nr:heme biosynthesis protein HemY [Notoacmeibacter sp. MSK16QG-6]MCP1199245.1 heme biosynthesis protein HemY [Notoacmeibacter sp. MSK16QG-6]
MIKLVLFFLLVLGLAGLFAWVADLPGSVMVTLSDTELEVSLLFAAVAIVALIAATMIAWWFIKGIIRSPERLTRHFRSRKRDRGYQALSTGMIAIGAGDSGLARKMNARALQNLDPSTEPLLHLLDAQTSLLEGNHDKARHKFEAMLEDPETRPLGLHGLYLEAQKLGETRAARHFAELAAKDAPQLDWASRAAMEARTANADWDGALTLLDRQLATKQIAKEIYERQRAVLMTAKSMEIVDTDPARSRSLAAEAVSMQPEFVPAVLAQAKAAIRKGDTRTAGKVLEAAWKREPHPQIGDLYLHLRPGDPVQDRLIRARKLEQWKPQNSVAALVLARALYEAGEYDEARQKIEPVVRTEPRESAFLLLADIEDEQTGDEGRVRHWLAQAVKAPRDPAWTADGYVSEHWAPISPVTGRLDAFEWRVPVEQVLPLVDGKPVGAFEYDATVPVIPIIEADRAIPESRPNTTVEDVSLSVDEIEPDLPSEAPVSTGPDASNDAPPLAEEPLEPVSAEPAVAPIHRPGPPDDPGPVGPPPQKDSRYRLF